MICHLQGIRSYVIYLCLLGGGMLLIVRCLPSASTLVYDITVYHHNDGLVQETSNSSALAMELRLVLHGPIDMK